MTISVTEAGRRGGFARGRKVSAARLSDIGKKAAAARWGKREDDIAKATATALVNLNERDEGSHGNR